MNYISIMLLFKKESNPLSTKNFFDGYVFYFVSSPKDIFSWLLRTGVGRERPKHQLLASPRVSDQGSNPQPLQCTGWRSNQLGHTGQGRRLCCWHCKHYMLPSSGEQDTLSVASLNISKVITTRHQWLSSCAFRRFSGVQVISLTQCLQAAALSPPPVYCNSVSSSAMRNQGKTGMRARKGRPRRSQTSVHTSGHTGINRGGFLCFCPYSLFQGNVFLSYFGCPSPAFQV